MYIERLEIRGFGKLSGLDLRLAKGLNLIYGRNEAGKSTLQAFIKAMFYGLKGGRPAGDGLPVPLKRFRPWGGGSYGGVMEYRLENGLAFRVERDFERNTAELYDGHFNNITADFLSGRDKNLTFAEKQTGMNEACFERTVFVKQMETGLDQDGAAVLSSRLANASETGYEDVSFKKADRVLREALMNHVGTDRSSVRPVDRLNARLAELGAARASLKAAGMRVLHARTELQAARKTGEELLARKDFLERVKKLVELRKLLEGRMAAESAMKDSVRRIREVEAKLEEAARTADNPAAAARASLLPRPGDLPLPAALAAGSILALLFGHDSTPYAYGAAALLLAAAAGLLLSSILRGRRREDKKARNASAAGHEERLTQIMLLKDRQRELYSKASLACGIRIGSLSELRQAAAEAEKSVAAYEAALEEGVKAVCGAYESKPAGLFDSGSLEEAIYDSSPEWLENTVELESEQVARSLNDTNLKIRELETLLKNEQEDDEALQRIDEEEALLEERKAELEKTGAALKLAREVLREAGSEIRRSLTPALEKRMGSIAARLTGGRYTDLRVDESLSLKTVPPETGDVSGIGLLSGGTADQLYLALRLAMADVLAPEGESLPVFLDEVFSQYDDIRTGQALEFLLEEYGGRQVLLFTCKEREAAAAGEICGSRLNLLTL
jgi:DNA repair exonuclease SbcCD ATPase subunit